MLHKDIKDNNILRYYLDLRLKILGKVYIFCLKSLTQNIFNYS